MDNPRTELARITLSVLFIGGLIVSAFWILQPFLGAFVWATMIVVALPAQIGNGYLSMLGVTPSQMLSAGYVLQAGNWVRTGKGTVAGSGAAGELYPYRPDHLRLVTMNRNAKNKKNRYVTTLKHAKNVWMRKRRGSGPAKQPGSNVRADAPSTALDLVLGS